MIKIEKFVFNPFQVNTYIVYNPDTKKAFIIDPACYEEPEKEELTSFISENDLQPQAIINTHCHIDHLLGVEFIRKKYKIEFWCSEEDSFLIDSAVAQGEFFGVPVKKPDLPEKYLSEGNGLSLGDQEIRIFHVPGHSPGSLVFYLPGIEKLITGDVLFSGSIGRTDLPGGDYQTLVNGIKSKLLTLGDKIEFFPGHGPSSSIGNEKLTNPFLQ